MLGKRCAIAAITAGDQRGQLALGKAPNKMQQ
jgi:hypothetical protein